ncbi:hypothetical protein [Microbacterium sp. NPDC078849]
MIEYRDNEAGEWKVSRFHWLPDDIDWLNSLVGWPMYRRNGDAA